MITVSNSEMDTFMDCKRKWMLQYYYGWEKVEEPQELLCARDLGTVVHGALQAYYETGEESSAWADLNEERTIYLDTITDDVARGVARQKIFDKADAMVAGYFEHLAATGIDEGLTFSGIEDTVLTQLTEDVFIRGKIDMEAQTPAGDHIVIDHKTSQDIDRPVRLMTLGIPQALTYVWAKSRENRDRVYIAAAWNIIKSVKRSANAKPPFYARQLIRISAEDLETHERQLTGLATEMLAVRRMLDNGADHQVVAFPHRSETCLWKCPFFDVCASMNTPHVTPVALDRWGYKRGDPNARYQQKESINV